MKTQTHLVNKFGYVIFGFIAIFFVACNSSDSEPPLMDDNVTPFSIAINANDNYTGVLNESFQLTAVVTNSDGLILNNQDITWESSNNNIATINNNGILRLIITGQVSITASVGDIQETKTISINVNSVNLAAFSIDELSTQLIEQGGSSLLFINEETMSSTFVELKAGESIVSSIVDRDQVYYFNQGNVDMEIDGQTVNIIEGSVLFIAAESERAISMVNSDSRIVISQFNTIISETTLPYTVFTRAQIEAPRNPNQNIWNPFLNEESVLTGLYMLPQIVGGDNPLVHGFDEINIVTQGASRFQTDEGDVRVEQGSIVFVREGNGHAFNMLEEDIDIIILWNN